jgi:uncharacterized membrane protein YdjX (TVP38/TMEM64 family)
VPDLEPPGDPAPPTDAAAPPDPGAARAVRNLKIGAVVLVAAGLVAAYRLGLFEMFGEPARVKQALVALGPWGYLAFVAAYACLQPFGVPGTVFILAAPLIWSWPVAFALSMAGTMAASVDEALAKRGFLTVLTLRFIFWMPPMLHVFFGVSRVPFWTHFWGSLVGYILPLLATAYFGQRVFDFLRDAPPSVWIGMAAAVAAVIAAIWLVRRRSRRAAAP